MNLTGHWKGKYTYGKGYPSDLIGTSEPFEFEIWDEDGLFTGTCVDSVVSMSADNDSTIRGVFKDKKISFKKSYKYHFALSESNEPVIDETVKYNGVDYTGRLYRKFFFGKHYFSGRWSITAEYRDQINRIQTFKCEGTWSMRKVL
jgi:hypothetical protein